MGGPAARPHAAVPGPREALFDAAELAPALPVCDHYAGTELRMVKSLELQARLGPVFDVTLDCEDGAPVGGEVEHAALIATLVEGELNVHGRVGARGLPPDHPRFEAVLDVLVGRAGARLAYLMLPKPRDAASLSAACDAVDAAAHRHGLARAIPLHALIETHGALRDVMAIAAHPRIESLSFGLMDFVAAHRGAIPLEAMTAQGQFEHPLVVRAKLEISAACHAYGKTPSHCVVTEFRDSDALQVAARRAAAEFGYTRMWSIHPSQVEPIVEAFAPTAAEVDLAIEILTAAQDAHWAPIRHLHGGAERLHDRASYRYLWQVLERAHRTQQPLPAEVRLRFFGSH
ncbi:MAG: HpcH/HpaI aldolase/citrate lyase family protein [Betaproteobacteria bacterium]